VQVLDYDHKRTPLTSVCDPFAEPVKQPQRLPGKWASGPVVVIDAREQSVARVCCRTTIELSREGYQLIYFDDTVKRVE
jgi:hypothetical protein